MLLYCENMFNMSVHLLRHHAELNTEQVKWPAEASQRTQDWTVELWYIIPCRKFLLETAAAQIYTEVISEGNKRVSLTYDVCMCVTWNDDDMIIILSLEMFAYFWRKKKKKITIINTTKLQQKSGPKYYGMNPALIGSDWWSAWSGDEAKYQQSKRLGWKHIQPGSTEHLPVYTKQKFQSGH